LRRHDIEERFLAVAVPFLLAAGAALLLPPLPGAGTSRPGFRGALLLWGVYHVLAGASGVFNARLRGGLPSAEFQGRPSSAFLRGIDAPRFCTDEEEATWYLTRRPVRLLPLAGETGEIRRLAEGGFDGVLVLSRTAGRSHILATRAQLLDAGLLRNWEPAATFPDLVVYRRRE
jgi:hypothetical protein